MRDAADRERLAREVLAFAAPIADAAGAIMSGPALVGRHPAQRA